MTSYIRTYKVVFFIIRQHDDGRLLALGPAMDVCNKLQIDLVELAELFLATQYDQERFCDIDYYTADVTDAESVLETAEYLEIFREQGFSMGETVPEGDEY